MAKVTRIEGKKGFSYQIDYFDPKGKRVRKMFKKKKDAEAELGKRVSLMAEGRYLDVKKDVKITLHELIERYAQAYANQVSYINSKHFFLKNFEDFIGRDTLISQISWDKITEYRSYLENKKTFRKRTEGLRRPSSVNREISTVRHLFSEATQWELIERSPFEGKRKVLKKEPDQ